MSLLEFSLKTLKTLKAHSNENSNLVFSPLAIGSILLLTFDGQEDVSEVLGVKKEELIEHCTRVLDELKTCSQAGGLVIQNVLYAQTPSSTAPLHSELQDPTISTTNFTPIFTPPFHPKYTNHQIFISAAKFAKKIPFLSSFGTLRQYTRDADFEVVQLACGDWWKMVVLMATDRRVGLEGVMEELDGKRFRGLVEGGEWRLVNVKIPKFRIESSIKWEELGLSGMEHEPELREHHAVINVAEGEVEPSDSDSDPDPDSDSDSEPDTDTDCNPESDSDPIDFIANRPFLFTVLFQNQPILLGTFSTPE